MRPVARIAKGLPASASNDMSNRGGVAENENRSRMGTMSGYKSWHAGNRARGSNSVTTCPTAFRFRFHSTIPSTEPRCRSRPTTPDIPDNRTPS